MPPPDDSAGARVTRGIDRLAPGSPLWWAPGPHQVDLGTLDFLDLEHGILAQVHGSHEKGLGAHHIPPELAPTFGFAAWNTADNEELKAAWKVIISSFRADATALYPPR